ncbi:hypothetical protein HMPREF0682_2923 [Propionibacterium acidifaciens F0233]|uniref:Uncharacterized protein n=1 Tax=Propionibacterium acidifaciens F0233 TaxID=553198 RepID=U2R0U3_9ACTN|nr:hypothetical protein HMPREF0682_2923 [Propionibacterium acidifaciens F0233]
MAPGPAAQHRDAGRTPFEALSRSRWGSCASRRRLIPRVPPPVQGGEGRGPGMPP